MTSTDQTLLIILTCLLSLYFIMCIILTVLLIKITSSVKRVVDKAEHVVDNAESVSEVIKDNTGKISFFKVLYNIMNMASKNKKDK
ncbi:MAG TPA: hypothetical protein VL989_02885 [Candidatus Sulfotelmatobacter sp.]|nr:hypothetical protein [Candidatus Sulfotelmatobacter sp.]